MKPKRYWLRGVVIGIVGPLIGASIFSLILYVSGEKDPTTFGFIFVLMAWPAIVVLTPICAIIGWLYGRGKKTIK
jgi:predicted membrane channel-forming protein YqfA (hemolysin III family)